MILRLSISFAILALLGAETTGEAVRPNILGVVPLRTSFSELESLFGSTPRARGPSPDGPSVIVACYYGGAGADRTFVLFESGPNGGYGQVVSGFVVTSLEPSDLRPDTRAGAPADGLRVGVALCSESIRIRRDIGLSNGLRLGMNRQEVFEILGSKGGRIVDSSLVYTRDDRVLGGKRPKGPSDWAEVSVLFSGERVCSIRSNRSEMM